jgi:hypothetical protein
MFRASTVPSQTPPSGANPRAPRRTRPRRTWRWSWRVTVGLPALIFALSIATGVLAAPLDLALQAASTLLAAPAPTAASAAPPAATDLGTPPVEHAPYGCTGENATGLRQPVNVGPEQHLCGNVTVIGADVAIRGSVAGSVAVAGGSATIAGHVGGSVTVLRGNLTLLSGADIGGSVTDIGGTIRRDPASHVGGDVQEGLGINELTPLALVAPGGAYAFPWAHVIFWALAGAALALFYPSQLMRVRGVMRRRLPGSVIVGALAWVVGAVLALALFVTCLGIPLALLLGAGLWIASVVGTVALGYWIGDRLLGAGGYEGGSPLAPTVLGVSLIALVKAVPCIGAALTVIVACAGLGASLLAWRESRRFGWRG